MAWIEKNIKKRPVLSLPDALSTLENRMGDCNEHAVLFAAMARAVYIPAKIEAGVVYLNGRFYYHAWNLVNLGGGIGSRPTLFSTRFRLMLPTSVLPAAPRKTS